MHSATYNDVLAQLGNSSPRQKSAYKGVAMTLIDSLSTLAVMGDKQEFCRASKWITDNIDFNVDVRVNVFEANIRLVGGLLSAHMLASDPSMGFNTRSADEDAANGRGGDYSHQQDHDGDGDVDADDAKYHAKNHRKFTNVQRMKGGQRSEYVPPGRYKTKPTISRRWERAEQIRRAEADGSGLSADELKQEAERKREQREQYLCPGQDPEGLLNLAVDLGYRLLTAFDPESDLPYAWVNMKHGVLEQETQDTCTAGAGTLLLEFGLLSHLTGDPVFMQKADAAIMKLYSLKSELGLYGNSLNRDTGKWTNSNAGIGAGIDSFYEYLFKAYMMFGNTKYLRMFESAYAAVSRYCKYNDWYVEANMHSGSQSHVVFNSLQAFWPGLQVLVGDFAQAIPTQEQFFALWERYKALPERYHIKTATLHGSEKYYPLRPEFIESAFYLYRATHKPEYLEMGRFIVDALNEHTRTPYGFAQIKNVKTLKREDIMSSFFLSETCKCRVLRVVCCV